MNERQSKDFNRGITLIGNLVPVCVGIGMIIFSIGACEASAKLMNAANPTRVLDGLMLLVATVAIWLIVGVMVQAWCSVPTTKPRWILTKESKVLIGVTEVMLKTLQRDHQIVEFIEKMGKQYYVELRGGQDGETDLWSLLCWGQDNPVDEDGIPEPYGPMAENRETFRDAVEEAMKSQASEGEEDDSNEGEQGAS